jgi:N-acetylmuramoyl-L-alanine amidase
VPADRLPSRRINALASAAPASTRPKTAPLSIEGPPSRATPPSPPPATTAVAEAAAPSQAPQANRAGSYSLARQLGLGARRIVIDAGHGGHDPGTIGRGGLMEKDLVLEVALRLEKMVRQELRAEVVLTRSTDVFVPLEERTAIANSRGADLFLSVHANASRNPRARGIETYFLSFAKNPHAEEVAARENAISAATMKDLQGLVKAITLNSKIDESRDFASSVQDAMVENLRGRYPVQSRGVHQAPFYVLIGANMPSVLAEIAFVSNPEDERLLKTSEYREAVARSLFKGVRGYLESLARPPARALTDLPERSKVASGSR